MFSENLQIVWWQWCSCSVSWCGCWPALCIVAYLHTVEPVCKGKITCSACCNLFYLNIKISVAFLEFSLGGCVQDRWGSSFLAVDLLQKDYEGPPSMPCPSLLSLSNCRFAYLSPSSFHTYLVSALKFLHSLLLAFFTSPFPFKWLPSSIREGMEPLAAFPCVLPSLGKKIQSISGEKGKMVWW